MKRVCLFLLIVPALLAAQHGIEVTGRVSMRVMDVSYDEESPIKPDSISDDRYARTTLIPGLRQNINLALFARTQKLDLSLLGDVHNNAWNRMTLSDLRTINRLSLSARIGRHEIVLGDFFESASELFIQSREIRGAKTALNFNNLWNPAAYLETVVMGGIVQNAFGRGSRLLNLYRQYETTGQFRRYFGAASIKAGEHGRYYAGLRVLQGWDDDQSISGSLNNPLQNQSMGAQGGLYLLENRIHLFGEGLMSTVDTLQGGTADDVAWKAGIDLRTDRFTLMTLYQRLGYNYYTAGYPYLLNDRQGLKMVSAYSLPEISTFSIEAEHYENNLEGIRLEPTTRTRLVDLGVTSGFRDLPAVSLRWGVREDDSNTLFDRDGNKIETAKISRKYEGRISHGVSSNRISLSVLYLDFDDYSHLASGSPLGTAQLISSLNLYLRPARNAFVSAGMVFSRLKMTNDRENDNLYLYESSRWDLIPRKLKLESTISLIRNEASRGGVEDMLSDYWQVNGEVSVEYFFNRNISLKLVGGTDARHMKYTTEQAIRVLTSDYGPDFFNGNETYDAVIYGLELNWIF